MNAEGLRAVALFSLQIVIANYLICWLYLRSGSVGAATVHTSWNLVSTVYSFAAMDIAMTGLLALVTVTALGLDHARGRWRRPRRRLPDNSWERSHEHPSPPQDRVRRLHAGIAVTDILAA
jgi:hypothetical protein